MTDLEPRDWQPERQLVVDLLEKVGIPVGPFFRYAESVRDRQLSRQARLLQQAADATEQTEEQLLDAFAGDDADSDLLAHALRAAATSTTEDQIRGLARVLANASSDGDDAFVDDGLEVVRVLGELDAPRIRALHAMEGRQGLRYSASDLADEVGPVLADPVSRSLEDLALVRDPGLAGSHASDGDNPNTNMVTPFGRRVLEYLREVPLD